MSKRSSTTLTIKNATGLKPKANTPKKRVVTHTHAHDHTPVTPSKTVKTPVAIIKRNPLGHLLIEKMFREAGFRGGISSDKKVLEKYSTDESIFCIKPQVVIQPKSKADIEIATKVIARETKRFTSLSLTARAAGTGLGGGSLTDSIVIDVCTHLDAIGEVVERGDSITITCEPGAMWRDVEKKLKRHDAYLPPYTSSKDICSIGGSIANNAAGPDSLRYGHCADWVDSLEVVLCDGNGYTIKPLTYKEFKALSKEKTEHARIAREVFALVEKNETETKKGKPKTPKNTAGYALWHVLPEGVAAFKKGKGHFDLTRIITGSQGTVGIITKITMRALKIQKHTTLLVVPIFDLQEAAKVIETALTYNPINIELFDGLSFDLALKNPDFFKGRLDGIDYYRTMLNMYATYHIRYGRKTPEFTILITLDEATTDAHPKHEIVQKISTGKTRARVVTNKVEAEMLWQIRRASYTLSKFQDPKKRPAAFLEDMTVPPENLSRFFMEVKKLLKEFNVTAAIHGHGGNGHLHFYPLLDFTEKTTPLLVEKMAERFYSAAVKFKGNICGEHNDSIISTRHLNKLFSKGMISLFEQTEHIFDPDDIFNPGKKVHPRFDVKGTMRTTN
jgi:FAD/FMN-containing dehydrogenase